MFLFFIIRSPREAPRIGQQRLSQRLLTPFRGWYCYTSRGRPPSFPAPRLSVPSPQGRPPVASSVAAGLLACRGGPFPVAASGASGHVGVGGPSGDPRSGGDVVLVGVLAVDAHDRAVRPLPLSELPLTCPGDRARDGPRSSPRHVLCRARLPWPSRLPGRRSDGCIRCGGCGRGPSSGSARIDVPA